jgi:cell wall-associated NlpC family hydrolase
VIVTAARSYLGVPFRHQGQTRAGMDCAGLVLAVARDCAVDHPDGLAYAMLPDLRLLDDLLPRFCSRIAEPEPGAVLRFKVAGRAQHLGICGDHASGLSVIHANMTVGRVCEHRLDDKWRRRLVSVWRMGVH